MAKRKRLRPRASRNITHGIVDSIRHLTIFDPDAFGERRVDVVGAGAIGSKVVMSLAKLGIQNIHAWDFDTVAEHNIANQAYYLQHIGMPKVRALKNMVRESTGIMIHPHNAKVERQQIGPVVILCVDSMTARKSIFENCIRLNPRVEFVAETRMGTDIVRSYAFRPYIPEEVDKWIETLCNDEDAEESVCGTKISVGPTADIAAQTAVWSLIKWFAGVVPSKEMKEAKEKPDNTMSNEVVITFRPFFTMARSFEEKQATS